MGDEDKENTKLQKVSELRIKKVVNGYILSGYMVEEKIANTLAEVLELARKEFVE